MLTVMLIQKSMSLDTYCFLQRGMGNRRGSNCIITSEQIIKHSNNQDPNSTEKKLINSVVSLAPSYQENHIYENNLAKFPKLIFGVYSSKVMFFSPQMQLYLYR